VSLGRQFPVFCRNMLFYLKRFSESMESHSNRVTSRKFLRLNFVAMKTQNFQICISRAVAYPDFFFFSWGVFTPVIFFFFWGGSTNSVEECGQRVRGSGGHSPLVRGSTQFTNE
jgi:hypothetical protein